MSCAWKEPNCRIGLILGTGTNACYLEEISAIGTVDPKDFPGQGPYSIGFFLPPKFICALAPECSPKIGTQYKAPCLQWHQLH